MSVVLRPARTDDQDGELLPLTWQQAGAAGQMLTRAFHNNPAVTYLFPDARRQDRAMPHV
jgi:hypothetical protein